MKVKLLSDVHLEFGDFDPGKGDVLVLAGDICVAGELLKEGDQRDTYLTFFNRCVEGYRKVFYVLGNHEHYGSDFDKTLLTLKHVLPEEISILHNSSECYEGVHFVGSTLWTSMGDFDMGAINEFGQRMNDYRQIVKDNQLLNVHDTIEENMVARNWFDQVLPTLKGPVFMITHHAPSQSSVKGRYVDSGPAYANSMEQWIEEHPQITHWVHGHIHHNNDYQIGGCRVISNPRGYDNYELNPDFNPDFEIDVPSESRANVWRF